MGENGGTSLPKKVADLERLIDRWARENPEDLETPRTGTPSTSGRLRRLIGVIAVAGALDGLRDDSGKERFVIKGGSAMEIRFGFQARLSKDLDAAFRGELKECFALIADALETGWSGFTGIIGEPEEITRVSVIPHPRRVDVKLSYQGKRFVTIPLEVSAAEASSIDQPENASIAIDISPVQIDAPETVALMPVRYQVAQKLHACTERFDQGENKRVRDLADIMLLRELVTTEDLASVKGACVEIFGHRQKHPWPPTIVAEPGWAVAWEALANDENLSTTLEEAMEIVTNLVTQIDDADL